MTGFDDDLNGDFGIDVWDVLTGMALAPLGVAAIPGTYIVGKIREGMAEDGIPFIPDSPDFIQSPVSTFFGPGASELKSIDDFMRSHPLNNPESFKIKERYFQFFDPASPAEQDTVGFLTRARAFKEELQRSEGILLEEKQPFFPPWTKPLAVGTGIVAVGAGVALAISKIFR